MLAGQKSRGSNGLENFLFPLEYMYVTQGEDPPPPKYNTYSHTGTYTIDFQGWGENGRVYNCPYYAPFDCTCVRVNSDSSVIWQSNNQVNFADGTVDRGSILVAHQTNWTVHYVGETKSQGDLLGYTGVGGTVTGDHVHIECGKGLLATVSATGYQNPNGTNSYWLVGSSSLYNNMFIDDTHIIVDLGYNWKTTDGGTPEPPDPPVPTHGEADLIRFLLVNVLKWK